MAAELDYMLVTPEIWSAFLSRGVAVIHNFLSKEHVSALLEMANTVYAAREERAARGEQPAPNQQMYIQRTILLEDFTLDGQPAQDACANPILNLAAQYLGGEPKVYTNSLVRRVGPKASSVHLPFHQDQRLLEKPLVNIWIALSESGRYAPGLEIVVANSEELLPTSGDPGSVMGFMRHEISEKTVLERFGKDALWRPVLAAGDALVFRLFRESSG